MFLASLRGASERVSERASPLRRRGRGRAVDPQERSGLAVDTEQSDGPQRRPRSGGQTSEPGSYVRLRRETQAEMCNGVHVAFCVHE